MPPGSQNEAGTHMGSYRSRTRQKEEIRLSGAFEPHHTAALQGRQGKHSSLSHRLTSKLYFLAQKWKVKGPRATRNGNAQLNVTLRRWQSVNARTQSVEICQED